jgi:MarR family transcriptional regulator, 2-MHQ and catechol-resistance regulon repressor
MAMDRDDVGRLAGALNGIAALYQFRSLNTRLYGALTVSQSYCLRILYFRGPRTMSELGSELKVRLSTITGVVDQLENKGLVERTDHPADRRSLHVRLTLEGRSLYGAAHEAFLSHLKPLFDRRAPSDREKFLVFLDEVADAIRGWQKNPRRKASGHGTKSSVRRRA